MSAVIHFYHELKACRAAFTLQQRIYAASRRLPHEEAHALMARALHSARAVGAGLTRAWARQPEPAEFMSRLCMIDAEVAETSHWLETAHGWGYLSDDQYRSLRADCNALGHMLTAMARACQRIAAAEVEEPTPRRARGAL